MIKLRRSCLILFGLLLVLPLVATTDPTLLRLVMPDAKVVAGLQVTQTKSSAFGQFILSHMQVEDPQFQKFIAQTGFDPRRDVTELVMASNWEQATPQSRWLVAARGVFNIPMITSAAIANGGASTDFQGLSILTYAPTDQQQAALNGIAFLDQSTAIMGDIASVKSAIQRQRANTPLPAKLRGKIQALSAKNDFWFATLVPISEFAGVMPDPNLSSAMKGNLLGAVHEASGGIRFGDTVNISGEAVTRSDKDAQALEDVFRFVAGLIQGGRQNDPAAGQIANWVDTMDLQTKANVMTVSLAIPEKQLEQMLNTMRQETQRPRKKPAAPQIN
jgi:hypothetical protein